MVRVGRTSVVCLVIFLGGAVGGVGSAAAGPNRMAKDGGLMAVIRRLSIGSFFLI